MTTRKLVVLIIKIISVFFLMKACFYALIVAVAVFALSLDSGILKVIAPFIGVVFAVYIPIWCIRNADWIAKKIIENDEPISFPEKWFHSDLLLVAIFVLGLYQVIDGVVGIANSVGQDMQYSNIKWYISAIGPITRTVLGLFFATCPQCILRIVRNFNIFGQQKDQSNSDSAVAKPE